MFAVECHAIDGSVGPKAKSLNTLSSFTLHSQTPHVLATGRDRFPTFDHLHGEALAGDEVMAHGIAYTSVSPCCSDYGCRIVSVVYISLFFCQQLAS
jgi:hypothetical protein